jgi:hypothetical protein
LSARILTLLIVMSAALTACVSDQPQRRAPRPGPQPRNAAPSHLVVNVKDFVDSDDNVYLDTVIATVYVFAEGYALPLDAAGTFTFRLSEPGGGTLAEWVISPDQAEPCRIKTQVGPGYGFTLDLRRAGAEKVEHREAALIGEFTDAKGRSIRSGRLSVTLGQVR